jgi:NAD(P)-dependent dehydrogenase (short-subunit alcohol dehydrogenase family)
MKSFRNKTAVITGAGSGLGRSLAVALNQAGAHLALCDLDLEGLQQTKELLPLQNSVVSLHPTDVADRDQMTAFAAAVIQKHGQVDILINNAGITLTPIPLEKISDEQFKKVIAVNMWGVYNGIQAFLPYLSTQPEASVVTISSLAGLVGLTGYAPYAMSKFAIRGLSESLAMEYAQTKLHFMVVHPGGIKTNLIKNAPNINAQQQAAAHKTFTQVALLSPDKVAHRILKGIHRKRNRLILGIDARIVYTIRRLFPQKYPQILNAIFSQMTFV